MCVNNHVNDHVKIEEWTKYSNIYVGKAMRVLKEFSYYRFAYYLIIHLKAGY